MLKPARPLKITVVSPDISVLHELSWVLAAFGYTVATSKDTSETASWRQLSDSDFLLFDGRTIAKPKAEMLAHQSDNPLYRIFLYDPASTADLPAWFEAGANDGLRLPISRGELMARLRTGARILEFQRRMQEQSSRSRLPVFHSQRGLLRKLSKFNTEGKSVTLGHTLLTTAIDWFQGFSREAGELAARDVLSTLATVVKQNAGGNAMMAYNGDGVFQVLLPGRKAASAHVIAEHIGQQFREAQTDSESHAQLSVTTAIVPWHVGIHADQLLAQGLETLAIAQQSGGNCIVEYNQFVKERIAWQNELTAGNPFVNMSAQDVMEPFPALLERDAPNHAFLAALLRSGAPVWPFVDREGKLVGVIAPDAASAEVALTGSKSNISRALTIPETIDYNAAFPEIYEAFSTKGCLTMVVVADHRPIGYLSRNGFLSLIEPIDSDTYLSTPPTPTDSRQLLVATHVSGHEPAFDFDQ